MLDYGSFCSGIEAASVAWEPIGFTPAWFSEIDTFPASVLAHHWPHVFNVGDMTLIPQYIRSRLIPAPLVAVGGTPCQSYSVAGKRLGLDDPRGQLTLSFVDSLNAIDEVRGTGDECLFVWENVPGVLFDGGNAFGEFIARLVNNDQVVTPEPCPSSGRSSSYWQWDKKNSVHKPKWPKCGYVVGPQRAIAWRVLDAQYFGVAQRRPRLFVVGSARKGFDPAKVLFEFEGVRRDARPRHPNGAPIDTGSSVVRAFDMLAFGQYGEGVTSCAVKARDYKDATTLVVHDGRVRKLMPKEYARLQKFPDNHCDIGSPDAAQYKAYGNSMAVPCMEFIGLRLCLELFL